MGPVVQEREQRQVVEPIAGLGNSEADEQHADVAFTQCDAKRSSWIEH
jgi:hypothetical protein